MPNGVICGGAVDGSNQLGEIVTCQAIVTLPDGAASAAVEAIAPRAATDEQEFAEGMAEAQDLERSHENLPGGKRSRNWNGLAELSADCDLRFGRQPADAVTNVVGCSFYQGQD